jgi:hypothetical protein
MARINAVIRLRANLRAAREGSATPPLAWVPAIAGACVGLALLIAGAVGHSSGLSKGGITVIVTITVLTGVILIAIGAAGARHNGPRHR